MKGRNQMKELYIIYAHRYADTYNGYGIELSVIGVARNQTEIDTIINNFRKERQKHQYWISFDTDKDKNIICSVKKFENKYLK